MKILVMEDASYERLESWIDDFALSVKKNVADSEEARRLIQRLCMMKIELEYSIKGEYNDRKRRHR